MLDEHNFIGLTDEDYSNFPSLTNPHRARPNREYVGLFAPAASEFISTLTQDTVYFTSADSDRDRLANLG